MLAPLGCGVITGAGGVIEALKVGYGDSIAIFGTGGVGLSAVMAARLVGAKQIVAVDINRARLDLALELGATHVIDAGSEDVVKQIRAVTGRGMSFSFNTTTVGAVHSHGPGMPGDERHGGFRCRAARGVGGRRCSPCSRVAGSCAAFSAATPILASSCPG